MRAWEAFAGWLQARSGAPNGLAYKTLELHQRRRAQFTPGPPERETEALARSRLAVVLTGVEPDHPVLRVLSATLEVFRERGIPVFVYIVPINVEHLERMHRAGHAGGRRRPLMRFDSFSFLIFFPEFLLAYRLAPQAGAERPPLQRPLSRRRSRVTLAGWTRSSVSATLARDRRAARSRGAGAAPW